MNLAIIPARSGSKGLKNKNIKLLNNEPLISYSIVAAIKSGVFDVVHVSTDSREYCDIAKKYGADVPFLRDESTSHDTASTWEVAKEVIGKYESIGKKYDMFTVLQPTSPMRTYNDIVSAYEIFSENEATSVVSVTEVDHSPLWMNTLNESKSMYNFISEEVLNRPRQELDKFYRINGAIYMISLKDFKNADFKLYGENSKAYIMPRDRSVDIDTIMDFEYAEFLFARKLK